MNLKPLASEVVSALLARGLTLSTAESCTGGRIGAAVTGIPGSSQVYLGGIISYTNGVKEKLLGVPGALLAEIGAVSGPVAEQMAKGARAATNSGLAVSATGLAGPGGDDYGNPVGTVFLGYADKKTVFSREFHFQGDRETVQNAAAQAALELLLEMVNKI